MGKTHDWYRDSRVGPGIQGLNGQGSVQFTSLDFDRIHCFFFLFLRDALSIIVGVAFVSIMEMIYDMNLISFSRRSVNNVFFYSSAREEGALLLCLVS
ncbi:hypothetical protein SDJN02_16949, partial [Cucurbita argyrosperma subsp. argyrosperma]